MPDKIIIGKFGKVHGIKGWIRVNSFAHPKENILNFSPWFIKQHGEWQELDLEQALLRGNNIVAKLTDVDDRELAQTYTNIDIYVEKSLLPNLPKGEYYWHELEGLAVVNQESVDFGTVQYLFGTGSNDVMVVKNAKERLIPYIDTVIVNIDLDKKLITVDWDAEF